MENEITPIAASENFCFACHPDVPCFNECCQDLNQSLTPYDIMRLKNGLGISSRDFLKKYTAEHVGPETGFPIITLKPISSEEKKCPFVTQKGCSVYEDRPASCRIYPLARGLARNRQTGEMIEQFALIKESHCLGFKETKSQNASEWTKSQEMEVYNEINDLLMEIIALKNHMIPGPLDIRARHIFHMSLYDIDTFKTQVFENDLLKDFNLDEDTVKAIETDDLLLLRFGFRFVKKALFNVIE